MYYNVVDCPCVAEAVDLARPHTHARAQQNIMRNRRSGGACCRRGRPMLNRPKPQKPDERRARPKGDLFCRSGGTSLDGLERGSLGGCPRQAVRNRQQYGCLGVLGWLSSRGGSQTASSHVAPASRVIVTLDEQRDDFLLQLDHLLVPLLHLHGNQAVVLPAPVSGHLMTYSSPPPHEKCNTAATALG